MRSAGFGGRFFLVALRRWRCLAGSRLCMTGWLPLRHDKRGVQPKH